MKRTRLFALLLCLTFVVTASLSGCNTPAATSASASTAAPTEMPTTAAATPEAPTGLTLPLSKTNEKIKLYTTNAIVATHKQANPADYEIIKVITQETGIQLDWKILEPDYNTAMQTMLAAGDVDADLITVPGNYVKYISAGLFMPLDDLIANNAPDIKKVYDQRSDIKKLCSFDGKQYLLADRFCVSQDGTKNSPADWTNQGIIRSDVLKALGLSLPQTMDELHNYLTTWKQQNPSKYPWVMRGGFDLGGSANCTIMSLAGAYGITLGNNDGSEFYPDTNGKIVYQYTLPQMKDYLTEMNKWWNEGLVDPSFTGWKDQTNAMASIANGDCIFTQGWATEIPAYGWFKTPNGGQWIAMTVPKGPNGDQVIMDCAAGVVQGAYHAVMANSKHADLAIKWLDYALFTDVGLARMYYGLEGKTYDLVNGVPTLKDSLTSQKDWTTTLFDMGTQMVALPLPFSAEYTAAYDKFTYTGNGIGDQYDYVLHMKDGCLRPFYEPLSTADEDATFTQYATDLNTYRNEMVTKFVTGKEPLSKWDDFVAQLNTLGLDKLIAVEQAKYDRVK